jgi:hypothetical protein
MLKVMLGFIAGIFAGILIGRMLPVEFLIGTGTVLMMLTVIFFVVFHLGLRDFQDY